MFPQWIDETIELRKNGLSYAKIGELLNAETVNSICIINSPLCLEINKE